MDLFIPALILSKILELSTTEYGISKGYLNEGNLLIEHKSSRIVLNISFAAGSPFIYKSLKRKSPKTAKIVAIAIIAGNGYLTYRNIKLMRQR